MDRHQRRQAIVSALQPVVLDRHVLAFDVAGFVQAFAECGLWIGSRQIVRSPGWSEHEGPPLA